MSKYDMKTSIVLLSKDGNYVSHNGKLPTRTKFDKSLLKFIVHSEFVLCSQKTKEVLPKSILNNCHAVTTHPSDIWTVNLGISTYNEPSDIFVIVHSPETMEGKPFNFKKIGLHYDMVIDSIEYSIYWNKSFELCKSVKNYLCLHSNDELAKILFDILPEYHDNPVALYRSLFLEDTDEYMIQAFRDLAMPDINRFHSVNGKIHISPYVYTRILNINNFIEEY